MYILKDEEDAIVKNYLRTKIANLFLFSVRKNFQKLRYISMIVMTTATSDKQIYFIPREYATSDLSVDLTDDITGVEINPDSQTYTQPGRLFKSSCCLSWFKRR